VVIELTKQIKLVRPEAKAMFPYSNSLFVDDTEKVIIDAGAGGRAYAGLPLEDIRLLLLTHSHFDHVNGVSFFSHAQIMAGQEELGIFLDEAEFNRSMGYQHWQELMGTPLQTRWEKMSLPDDVPSRPGFQSISLDSVFTDGSIFDTGSTYFIAVHTPGHSPGHYAFFFPRERILFSGDLDLSMRGPWYGGEACDLDDLINSIRRLISLKPQVLVSSHRRVIDAGIEELFEKYLNIAMEREARILKFTVEPRTINEIADQKIIDEWEQNDYILFAYKMMIIKHLNRLMKMGRVSKTPDGRYVSHS
jgi:Zn-dependent hydrolases, including glyoxylases